MVKPSLQYKLGFVSNTTSVMNRNMKIKKKFKELEIELAYPTQNIYLNNEIEKNDEIEKIDSQNIKNEVE